MIEPLVSAVIVTHNRRDLVVGAISSVQTQTYRNIELFVIDDASQDGTRELLEEKSHEEGFSYIYIPSNESKGGNHARNLGIKASHGEFVAFLDDDDEWLPDKIIKQVSFMQEHPECGVVSCFNIVEFNFDKRYSENRDGMMEGDVHELIFSWIPFVTSTALYRRQVLIDVGMFDEDLRYWQETELNIRVAQVANFGCVHEELCLYRVVDSDSKRLTNHLEGWIEAVDYIERKHSLLINNLPKDIIRKHKLLIAVDGLSRSIRVRNKKYEKKFRFQILKLQPSIKNFIKLVFSLLNLWPLFNSLL